MQPRVQGFKQSTALDQGKDHLVLNSLASGHSFQLFHAECMPQVLGAEITTNFILLSGLLTSC